MSVLDPDPLLRRLERRALWFCVLAVVAGLALRRGNPDVALGVAGGGALAGISYWAIRSSIDGLLRVALRDGPGAQDPPARLRRGVGYGLRFVGRYAVLGVVAYVLLVIVRLHPVGMIVGVSALVVAAALEAAGWVLGSRR